MPTTTTETTELTARIDDVLDTVGLQIHSFKDRETQERALRMLESVMGILELLELAEMKEED